MYIYCYIIRYEARIYRGNSKYRAIPCSSLAATSQALGAAVTTAGAPRYLSKSYMRCIFLPKLPSLRIHHLKLRLKAAKPTNRIMHTATVRSGVRSLHEHQSQRSL